MSNPQQGTGALARPGIATAAVAAAPLTPEQKLFLTILRNRESHKGAFLTEEERKGLREEIARKMKSRAELEKELAKAEQENEKFKEEFSKLINLLKNKYLSILGGRRNQLMNMKTSSQGLPQDKLAKIDNEIGLIDKYAKYLNEGINTTMSPIAPKYVTEKIHPALKKYEQVYQQEKQLNPNTQDVQIDPRASFTPAPNSMERSNDNYNNNNKMDVVADSLSVQQQAQNEQKSSTSDSKQIKRERSSDELHDERFRSKWKIVENIETIIKIAKDQDRNEGDQNPSSISTNSNLSLAKYKESVRLRKALGW